MNKLVNSDPQGPDDMLDGCRTYLLSELETLTKAVALTRVKLTNIYARYNCAVTIVCDRCGQQDCKHCTDGSEIPEVSFVGTFVDESCSTEILLNMVHVGKFSCT